MHFMPSCLLSVVLLVEAMELFPEEGIKKLIRNINFV
jgi:hypothetical protein